ncbi:MAG: DUF2179 domain-containing protein [Proteobacteria bacterium]|nr:DUF2179 domain-containing protein [Pseudomonadota bacterium]
MDPSFFQSPAFNLIVVPILIFLGRIADVTVGTMRIIFVSRGLRMLSVVAGFVEIMVWLLVLRQIMGNLDHWTYFIAYAAGFSAGNYIGITIERHLAIGHIIVRVITQKEAPGLERYLRNHDFMMTVLDARGDTGPVKVLFMVIKRKALGEVLRVIRKFHPLAYYTVEDLRYVSQRMPDPVSRRSLFFSRSVGKGK